MKFPRRNVLIFCVFYLAYTAIYIARLNLTVANPVLVPDLMSSAGFGLLGSVFSVVYAAGRLLNGALADRVRPAWMIGIGLFFTGAGNFALSFLPPYAGFLVLWALNAYAQSMLWSAMLRAISDLFDLRTAKRLSSILGTAVAVGNILGILLNTSIVARIGLSYVFLIPALSAIFFCLAVLLVSSGVKGQPVGERATGSFFGLLKSREIRAILPPILCHGVMKDNISLWMTAYFVAVFGIDLKQSAWFVVFIPLVGLAGRLLYPLCFRLAREREHLVSQGAFVVCLFSSVVLCLSPSAILAAICLSLIYAAVSIINTSVLAIYPLRFSESGNVASVSGLTDFSTYLGAGISGWLYGYLIGSFGYFPMFLSWAILAVVGFALLAVFRRKFEPAPLSA